MGWILATQMAMLTVGGVSGSGETFTSPVFNDIGSQVIACIAQNVGIEPVLVTAELRGANGAAIDGREAVVPPGRTVELVGSMDVGSGYCAFTFDADPQTLRGYVLVRSPAGDTIALFPHFTVRRGGVGLVRRMSPPLRVAMGPHILGCMVQNLSGETVPVDVELIDAGGTVVESAMFPMLAGRFATIVDTADPHLGAYCRFSVAQANDEVRGYAILFGVAGLYRHLVFPAATADNVAGLSAATPPVSSIAGDATSCVAQNLGNLAVTVGAEIVDAAGAVIDDGSDIIPPGAVETVAGHTDGGADMVCRFAFNDAGDEVRAFITRYPAGLGTSTDLLETAQVVFDVPAQATRVLSPPVGVAASGFLNCTAVNVSAADETVHVEVDDGSGAIVAMVDLVVPAGGAVTGPAVQSESEAFCTFTFDADPGAIRGFATRTNDAGTRTHLVFAATEAGPSPTATPTPSPTLTATSTRQPTSTSTGTRTVTPTQIATRTSAATATPSGTAPPPSSQTPTLVPDGTPTATPTGRPCAGDCDGNGTVSVDELVTLLNLGLGRSTSSCETGDLDKSGSISIDELVVAVSNALHGCA
jgi:hypothetical protein